jgi:ERCC4-type nuclease
MDHFEIEELLKSFEIICDTREQRTPRAEQRYSAFGVAHSRGTLSYGDYCGNIMLPDGRKLYDGSGTISAKCVVERKMNLDELAGCFTRGRDRFKREFERAAANNSRVFLLCEDGSIEKILRHDYRSRFTPKAFLASVIAWNIRYDMQLIFCSHLTSGMMIKEILYRDMKDRAEKGEFDVTQV